MHFLEQLTPPLSHPMARGWCSPRAGPMANSNWRPGFSNRPKLPLPGTENGRDPIFSPDGREIGFYSNGSWKKVPVQGGVPVTLAGAPFAYGATLGEDGSIIFPNARSSPLYRVPAPGAGAKRITELTNGE